MVQYIETFKAPEEGETGSMVDESVIYFSDFEDYYDTSAYSTSYNFDDDEQEDDWLIPYPDDSECGMILNDLSLWFSYIFDDGVPESTYS